MNNVLLAAVPSWVMPVVLVVLLAGMMLLTILPQKKRQKKAQEMMNGIRVGTKVKTIGGFVGTIKGIDNGNNTFTVDLSLNEDGSMMVTLDKSAVYTVLTATSEGVLAEAKPAEVTAADDAEEEAKKSDKKKSKKNKDESVQPEQGEDTQDLSIEKSDEDIKF